MDTNSRGVKDSIRHEMLLSLKDDVRAKRDAGVIYNTCCMNDDVYYYRSLSAKLYSCRRKFWWNVWWKKLVIGPIL